MRRSISILTMSWLLMTGSFAFAQDGVSHPPPKDDECHPPNADVSHPPHDITDDQVVIQMKDYLHHLNRDEFSQDHFQLQLNLLLRVKDVWKSAEIQKLRNMTLKTLLTTQNQNPYLLDALAFHNEDISTYPNVISTEDHFMTDRAIQFRQKLKWGIYEFDDAYQAKDMGFDSKNPSHLLLLKYQSVLEGTIHPIPLAFDTELTTIDLSSHETLLSRRLHHIYGVNQNDRFSILHPNFFLFKPNFLQCVIVYFDPTSMQTVSYTMPNMDLIIQLSPNQQILAFEEKRSNFLFDFNPQTSSATETHFNFDTLDQCHTCHILTAFSFSPDSHFVIAGTQRGNIFKIKIDPAEIQVVKSISGVESKPISLIAIHPNNQIIAYTTSGEHGIHLYDLESMKSLHDIPSLSQSVQTLFFTPSGELIIEQSNYFEVWDIDANTMIQAQFFNVSQRAKKILINQTGEWLAVLLESDQIFVYEKKPVLDLDLILFVDPAKVTPNSPSPTGGGGGGK